MNKLGGESEMEDSAPVSRSLLYLGRSLGRRVKNLYLRAFPKGYRWKLSPPRLQRYRVRRRDIPGIMLTTLPKSASVYIRQILSRYLDIPEGSVQIGRFPDGLIVPELTQQLAQGGAVAQCHVLPKNHNLVTLESCGIDRIVVHVRDPRQAMLSWVHYLTQMRNEQVDLSSLNVVPSEESYFSWSLTDQITWHIENYQPLLNKWIGDWLDASDDLRNVKIHFTKYEDLVSDPKEFFNSILRFYDIDSSLEGVQKGDSPQPGELHFRKGEIDEWRDVFTVEQANRASKIIPQRLFKQFGWPQDI